MARESLCWRCAKCTDGNLCEWADGEPVKGWNAKPTTYKDSGMITRSYKVISCPNYVEAERYEVSIAELCRMCKVSISRMNDITRYKLRKALNRRGYTLEYFEEERTYAIRKIRT